MKEKKSLILVVVVVLLGLLVCFVAINPQLIGLGNQAGNMDPNNGGYVDQNGGGNDGNFDTGFSEKNPIAGTTLKFKTKDTDGNEVDESIFKEKKLTLINIWGTFCSPCIDEMPDLEKLQKEYKDKINVIGLVLPDDNSAIKKVIEQTKVTYKNIISNDSTDKVIGSKFDYVPVTLLVDENGKVLETFVPGGASYEMFKSIVDEQLSK